MQPNSAAAQFAGIQACTTADVHLPGARHGLLAAHPAAGQNGSTPLGKPRKARMKKRKQMVLPSLEYVSILLEQELQGLHGAQQQQHQQQRRQPGLPQQNQHQHKMPSVQQAPEQAAQQHWPDLHDGQLQKRQKQQQLVRVQQDAPPMALDLQLPRNRSDLSNNRVEASPGRDRSQEQQQPQQQQQQPGSDAGEQAPGQPQPRQQQQPQPDQPHPLLQQQLDQAAAFAPPVPLPELSPEQQLPPPLPDLRGKALLQQLPLAIQLRQQFFTQRLISCQRSLDHKLLQGQLLLHQLLEDQQLQNQLIAELLQRCSRYDKREQKLKAKLLLQRQQQQQQQPVAAAAPAAAAASPDPAAAAAAAAAAGAATTPGGGSSRSCALVQAGPSAAAAAAAAGTSGGEAAAPGVAAATKAAHLAALAEEKALLEGCFNRVGAFVVGRLGRDCRWAALATGQKQRLLEQLEQRVISRLDGPLGLLEQLFAEPALLPQGASDGTGRSGSGGGAGGASRSGRSGGSGGAAVEQPLLLQRLFDDHHQASQQQQPAAKQHGQPQQRAPPPMVPCTMLGSRAVAAGAAAGPQPQAAGLPGPAEAQGAVVRSRSPAPPPAAAAGGVAGLTAVGAGPAGPAAADDDDDDDDDDDAAAAEDFLSVGDEGVGFAGAGNTGAVGAAVAGRLVSAAAGGDGSPVGLPAASAAALEDELLHGVFSSGMLPGSSCALELLPGLELPRPAVSSGGGCARGVGASSSSCLVAADRGAMLEYLLCANAACSTPVSGPQGQRQHGPLGSKRDAAAAGGVDDAVAGGALLTAAEAAKRLRLSSLEVPDAGMAMTLSDLFP